MHETVEAARTFLDSLEVAEPVTVVVGGRSNRVRVQSLTPTAATVGFGPGRWNVTVSPRLLASGTVLLSRTPAPAPRPVAA